MNVCLLTWWGDSLTYTMARAIVAEGHRVDILVTDRQRHQSARWGISARLREIHGATVKLDGDALETTRFDALVIQSFPRIADHAPLAARLAALADSVTLVSFGDLSRSWRDAMRLQAGEWRLVRPFLRKLKVVAYKDGYHPLDLFALLPPRRKHVGFDVHSKFLHVDALFRQIHAPDWSVTAPRRLCLNFVGSRDPRRRGEALDRVDGYLDNSGARLRHAERIMWKVYSDEKPGALPESEFVEILTHSDFTLAPPGHSLITHRPIEAMLRGSIPILNAGEAPIYELGLRDSENCLLVRNDDWGAAVARALNTSPSDVERMRRNILAVRGARLDYPALAAGICSRIGVAS